MPLFSVELIKTIISTMTLDAYLCPDYLNIFVAQGGLGGEAGMTGSIGEMSYVVS